MVGTKCESHGLYHLQTFTYVGSIVDLPSLIHDELGHPSITKLQQLVLSLSRLSTLSYESC